MSSKENGSFDMSDDMAFLKDRVSKLEGSVSKYRKSLSRIQKELFKSNFQLQLIEQNLKYVKRDRHISKVEYLRKITEARKKAQDKIAHLEKIVSGTISDIMIMEKDMEITKNKLDKMEKAMQDKIIPFKKNGRQK